MAAVTNLNTLLIYLGHSGTTSDKLEVVSNLLTDISSKLTPQAVAERLEGKVPNMTLKKAVSIVESGSLVVPTASGVDTASFVRRDEMEKIIKLVNAANQANRDRMQGVDEKIGMQDGLIAELNGQVEDLTKKVAGFVPVESKKKSGK